MTAFAPELAMSKMHRTVKEIKGARKERDRGRRRKARTSGAGWSSRDSLSLSAEEKYVPLRNGSKAPRVCFTTSYQYEKDGTPRKTRDVERGSNILYL